MAKRDKVTIIAEFGSSPAPEWDFVRWCGQAKIVGADAVKCQIFKAEHFAKRRERIYGHTTFSVPDDSEVEAKRPLEFPRERFVDFVSAAHWFGLQAGASVFDNDAVDLVAKHGDFIKLACREERNNGLLDHVMEFSDRIPIYRSIDSLDCFSMGRITTLFAIQKYPAPISESLRKLLLIAWNAHCFGYRWGWSSHTASGKECVAASIAGTSVIERHFCLSERDIEFGHSSMPGNFSGLARIIKAVRA